MAGQCTLYEDIFRKVYLLFEQKLNISPKQGSRSFADTSLNKELHKWEK